MTIYSGTVLKYSLSYMHFLLYTSSTEHLFDKFNYLQILLWARHCVRGFYRQSDRRITDVGKLYGNILFVIFVKIGIWYKIGAWCFSGDSEPLSAGSGVRFLQQRGALWHPIHRRLRPGKKLQDHCVSVFWLFTEMAAIFPWHHAQGGKFKCSVCAAFNHILANVTNW